MISVDEMDLSAVTVTRVLISPDLKQAKVFISIRDHHDERTRMMGLLRRHRIQLQERIGKNIFIKFTPRLHFILDTSIEKGDRVLSILAQMEAEDFSGKSDVETQEP